jgi:putative transposase
MAKEKKQVHRIQMTDGKRTIIQQLLQEYDIRTAEDIQEALKDRRHHQRDDGGGDGRPSGL